MEGSMVRRFVTLVSILLAFFVITTIVPRSVTSSFAEPAERRKLALQDDDQKSQSPPATECDRLAADPSDQDRPPDVPGVLLYDIDFARAIPACGDALEQYPDDRRIIFALGRALDA